MGMVSRAIGIAAAVAMLGVFLAPLWHFDLVAPQYPEGLAVSIWIDKLGGRADLINELNHYVGMRPLDESFFPEFSVMPLIVGLLCLFGIGAALAGRVRLLCAWVAVFAVTGMIGLGDFYYRLYEYGHDLSPDAPIRIPPFTPRLVGSYDLMNFHVTAYPGLGAAALVFAFLLGASAILLEWKVLRR